MNMENLATIDTGDTPVSFAGFLKDGTIVSWSQCPSGDKTNGENQNVNLWTKEGHLVQQFKPHQGFLASIRINENRETFVTSGADADKSDVEVVNGVKLRWEKREGISVRVWT